jgi:hypothetical protein
VTPNRKRDVREMAATMDHSDIRGLGTAFHLFLAGLPRSRIWDHHKDARIKLVEDSPHRARASRCRFGVGLSKAGALVSHLRDCVGVKAGGSGRDLHLPGDISDEAGELSSDRHAAFVLSHFPARVQFANSVRETQLCPPGDVAYGFGLGLPDVLRSAGSHGD